MTDSRMWLLPLLMLLPTTSTPAGAQAPLPAACPSIFLGQHTAPSACQLGQFTVSDLFFDTYQPLVSPQASWQLSLFDDRIDLTFKYNQASFSSAAPDYDDGTQYPFWEQRLYFTMTPLTPAGFWHFKTALRTSASATFTLPSAGSYAALETGIKISNDQQGGGNEDLCIAQGALGPLGCQLTSQPLRPAPFSTLPLGYFYGFLQFNAVFQNLGPGPLLATFNDIEVTASIYFTHDLTPVPEPATLGLLALGLLAAGTIERWRRRPPRRALNIGHKEATDCVGASGH